MADIFENTNEELSGKDNIKIADAVVANIASITAGDVEGVSPLSGFATEETGGAKFGGKILKKPVKLTIEDDEVEFTISVIVRYGYGIQEVSKEIQERVSSTVESMTGLKVTRVNVIIAGIDSGSEE